VRQRLGQHFLADANIVRVALRLAALGPDDVVLEVGPGLGVLTHALAESAAHVHAIEIDRALADPLAAAIAGHENVTVHWADAMQVDLAALEPPPTAFVANLPYSVATPLLMTSLTAAPSIERWCVMVQREVADRLFAAPSTAAYGAVSVLVQLVCDRTGFHQVSRSVFVPPPNVDSALVAFRRSPRFDELAPRFGAIGTLVHGAFSHRRKTLANALALSGVSSRVQAEDALAALGLPARIRAQELPPATFPELEQRLRPKAPSR
jgi:16S rRNA (adenine1518-N6/adenine1519-N6)-dimethyltransferase